MPFEDVGLYRSFPEMVILDVAEETLLKKLLVKMAQEYGPMYIRFPRKEKTVYYEEDQEFTIGKGVIVREGSDASIIASGIEVKEALLAAEELEQEGIKARVVDMFTIKPIDAECIRTCAEETGAIVTCENESIIGGLGSAVAEVLVESQPVPMERVGVQDEFGEVGPQSYLEERFGLTATVIAEKAKKVLTRKK